jgi:predicted dienelactone hydrolase
VDAFLPKNRDICFPQLLQKRIPLSTMNDRKAALGHVGKGIHVSTLYGKLQAVVLLTALLTACLSHSAIADSPRAKTNDAVVTRADLDAMPPAAHYSAMMTDASWFDAARSRTIPVRIYYPNSDSERFPVIVFSTGLGRSREDCAYLGSRWAGCGYVAVFVQHPGSDEAQRGMRPRKDLQKAFYNPYNVRNRPMDMIFVLDQLERTARDGSSLGSRLDVTRFGAAGHDFGSQTVLALAGQVLPGQIAFHDPRVKAVLAMSSPVPIGQVPLSTAYEKIAVPCLHITGTADNSIVGTTQAYQRRLPFDHVSAADQFLITLNGADHLTYSGHNRRANAGYDGMFQRLIADSSAAFWDAYLKHRSAAKDWLAGQGIKARLGGAGWVEKKLVQ